MSEHGTNARWQKHYRDGEEPCDDCKIARFEYRKRFTPNRANANWHRRIRDLAVKELIQHHRPEFLRLLHTLQEQHRATKP